MSVRILRPLPRTVTRPLSILALLAWVATMGVMINRSYLQASSRNLATDLASYGTAAQWRGVYYRGEKIGFTVSQVQATEDGFEPRTARRTSFRASSGCGRVCAGMKPCKARRCLLSGCITASVGETYRRIDVQMRQVDGLRKWLPALGFSPCAGRFRGLQDPQKFVDTRA